MYRSNFVIVTHARSGSMMLNSLLDSHPQIKSDGEIFNSLNQDECDKLFPKYYLSNESNESIRGFKLAYSLRGKKGTDIWEKTSKNNSLKIIHWQRSNLLRAYVSLEIAKNTNKWFGNEPLATIEEKPIKVDLKKCREWINSITKLDKISAYEFRHHHSITINYENFLFDKNKAIELLQFLQVDPQFNLTTNFRKQNPEPLKKLIINHEEIEAFFRNSRWSVFIEDSTTMD